MLKSLRNRILAFFLLLAATIALTVFPINYVHQKRIQRTQDAISELNSMNLLFSRDVNYYGNFLLNESKKSEFYLTGQSNCLVKHQSVSNELFDLLEQRQRKNRSHPLDVAVMREIEDNYLEFCTHFDSLVYYTFKRGYKGMGTMGELTAIAEKIEKLQVPYSFKEIRALEKEYFLTPEEQYVNQLIHKSTILISTVAHSSIYEQEQKNRLLSALSEYQDQFQQIVQADIKTGRISRAGYREELYHLSDLISADLQMVLARAQNEVTQQQAHLNLLFAFISGLLLFVAIGLSIYFSRHLVEHLEKLTDYISKLVESDFNYSSQKLSFRKSSTEVRQIYREFRNMVAQIRIREKQRDAALNEIKESEKRFRELADLLPQSIFETDKFGNIEYANKAWYKAFGYSPKDLREGLNLIEIIQTHNDNNLFGINKIENSDYVAIRKSGERFAALVYADNIISGNNIIGRRGIIIDATLRNKYIESLQRETVRAVKSDKQKSSFLANMSHEIRTPMNSIIGFANLLAAEGMPAEQKEQFVEHIQSSGKILLNLIDDIIDIAKIEAGEIKIKPTVCHPSKIIDELCHTFEGYKTGVGKSEIKLVKLIPEGDMVVRTDPFRLRQILSNLTSNAIKFTERGNVTISYNVKNEQWIEFSVEDTGMGLTQDELRRIFTRFQRTKRSEEKNISGTGLGLAISKNLVELLGGQMWVSSIPNQGTRFWFHIPYTPVPDSSPYKVPMSFTTGHPEYNWKGKTVLIAEDDDTSYVLLKSILKPTNASVIRAINGREAVEAVKLTTDIDIILMDIQMPVLNGYDASQSIKELYPQMPIIAQTAAAMDGDREKVVMAGCDDYITKPVIPENLLAKMQQFINPDQNTQLPGKKKSNSALKDIQSDIRKHIN